MDRKDREKYVFGSILLLANKLQNWGDGVVEDISMKQWLLVMLISKMGTENPTLKEVADFSGTSRQNVKKILEQLEKKGYVKIVKSGIDARALNVSLTKKTYDYFEAHAEKGDKAVNTLFSEIMDDELITTSRTLEKLLVLFGNPPLEEL